MISSLQDDKEEASWDNRPLSAPRPEYAIPDYIETTLDDDVLNYDGYPNTRYFDVVTSRRKTEDRPILVPRVRPKKLVPISAGSITPS
jgi:hypothetical protein